MGKDNTILIVVAIILAVILFKYAGLFGILAPEEKGLYQYAGQKLLNPDCNIDSWITDGKYVFSNEATVKTATSTFRFVFTDISRYNSCYSCGGNTCCSGCSKLNYNIDVYKDGNKIDSIINQYSLITSNSPCADLKGQIKKAYSDDGTVYNDSALSENSSGVNVLFGMAEEYGQVRCPSLYVQNRYDIVYPRDYVTVSLADVKIEGTVLSGKVNIQNNYNPVTGSIEIVYSSPSALGEKKVSEIIPVSLVAGASSYSFNKTVEPNATVSVSPAVHLLAPSSDFTNLNANEIMFGDSALGKDVSLHSSVILGDYYGTSQTIEPSVTPVVEYVNQTIYQNQTIYLNQTNNQTQTVYQKEYIAPNIVQKYGTAGIVFIILGIVIVFLLIRGKK